MNRIYSVFLLFLVLLRPHSICAYFMKIINNTEYSWRIKMKVDATNDTTAWTWHEDLGSIHIDGNVTVTDQLEFRDNGVYPVAIHEGKYLNGTISPYSIIKIQNNSTSKFDEVGNNSGYVWEYARGYNRWNSEVNFLAKKSHATSLYWIIQEYPKGGHYHKWGWDARSKKHKKWDRYKREHLQELEKKYADYIKKHKDKK